MNEVINAIKSRRSVRAYKSDALSKDILGEIIEAGTYAPTGHNGQHWHFSAVQDRALLGEVNVKTKKRISQMPVDWMKNLGQNPAADITHKAPVLVIVSSGKEAITGPADCTAAMQNMMVAAQSLGIGSCWMGFVNFVFDDEDLMKRLGVPEGFTPQQAAVFGYASGNKGGAPERRQGVVTYVGSFE